MIKGDFVLLIYSFSKFPSPNKLTMQLLKKFLCDVPKYFHFYLNPDPTCQPLNEAALIVINVSTINYNYIITIIALIIMERAGND